MELKPKPSSKGCIWYENRISSFKVHLVERKESERANK
jgi:hypothetical protein